jgi:hypothetical protein
MRRRLCSWSAHPAATASTRFGVVDAVECDDDVVGQRLDGGVRADGDDGAGGAFDDL